MTSRAPRLEWVPPLLVGASGAVAAEIALSLLLYGGPGFVRSLTTVLAIEGFAFAVGLWGAPADGPDLIDRVRRRWVLCLMAFLAAALYGSAWSFMPVLGEGRLGQAAGLAILGGLPLYAAGSVLGGISAAATTDPGGRLSGPGAAAAAGAALGFVATGFMLPRAPLPATMLVGCLVMLSLSGMLFGSVIGSRTQLEIKARRPSRHGEVRVQERRLAVEDVAVRELIVGAYLRRWGPLSEQGDLPWDVSVTRLLMPPPESSWRVLAIGGGASAAPRAVLREHPLGEIDIAERTAAVVELGREYFGTELAIERVERSAVAVGNLDDLISMVQTTYDLILVDTAALAPLGGWSGLSRASRSRLFDAVADAGTVAFGPCAMETLPPEISEGWSRREYRHRGNDEVVVLVRRPGAPMPDLARGFDGFESA